MHETATVLTISSAMLIPEETDKLVKVTDGKPTLTVKYQPKKKAAAPATAAPKKKAVA